MGGRLLAQLEKFGSKLKGSVRCLTFLGLQDACRKITTSSCKPGERSGISVESSKDTVTVFMSVNKWRVKSR